MLLNRQYRDEDWSCYRHFDQIDHFLSTIHYPSTTSRIPRSLTQMHLFKGSEFRLLLLFGFVAFEPFISYDHYLNLLCLATAMHYAETSAITISQCEDINELMNQFLYSFSYLFSTRHNVQVIHSMAHVAQSVFDYGQLHNYSAFNYESVLGA